MGKPKVLMIMALDSKEAEARYLRKCLEQGGVEVYHLDFSIRRTVDGGAAITPDMIAAAAGTTMPEIRALNHEGKCLAIMIEGAIKCAHELHDRVGFSGIFAAAGSLGTSLSTAVMRTFPFGIPKVMISTMASGLTQPFVGTKDITMMNSICDVAGLNTVTRRVFENGAAAVAGMAHAYKPAVSAGKPVVAMTTLSIIDKCTVRVRKALEERGFEVMVFHSQGNGGPTMDEIIREQDVSVVADLSLVEVSDYFVNGYFSGGPDRCKAALEKGVPTVFAPGCIDMMVAGPLADAQQRFPNRMYHVHNAQLTAVRSEAGEFRRMAEYMAGLIKNAKGPVAFFVPLGGFSSHDSQQGHLYDPSLPPVFAEHLKKVMPPGVPLETLPCHINDEPFADRVIQQVIAFQQQATASKAGR